MKIRVLSDLHLEFQDWNPPDAEAEVIVLAGDIHSGTRGIEWARRQFPVIPILYVPGNHEFYGREIQETLSDLQRAGRRFGVDVLHGRGIAIGGVRFLGATLWTDFALNGADPQSTRRAMMDAKYGMSDFSVIRNGAHGLFRPEHARAMHVEQVSWILEKLRDNFPGPTIVVSHHLPHPRSIHHKYRGSTLNPGFASDLSRLMGPPIAVWIHGHTHDSCDYVEEGTRIVCNPRGYGPSELNAAFDPMLTIEVDTLPVNPLYREPERIERPPTGGNRIRAEAA
ncbi:MAG TPA: metallophosphoesterase [Steroidobacteraceae bacterium]|nr:metallophosphoesterase [Steroidobacteraceae bacterium]